MKCVTPLRVKNIRVGDMVLISDSPDLVPEFQKVTKLAWVGNYRSIKRLEFFKSCVVRDKDAFLLVVPQDEE